MNEGNNQETSGTDDVEGSVDREMMGESTTQSDQQINDGIKVRKYDAEPEDEGTGGTSLDVEMNGNLEDDDEEESSDADDKDNLDESGSVGTDEDENETPTETLNQKQRYHTPKIFQDAITVFIPLDVTADLKIAIKKTRAKRIVSIFKRFPSLKKEAKNLDENNNDPILDDDEEENPKDKDDKQPPKKKKKLENVPHPDQFGSVLDYLEAKYVKGVMLEEEDDAPILDDEKSEGQGSVYSKDSFLDDTDLQRDVAEQVMASTTLTKLELEHEDGDFFVNVGNLEVENDDYGENYDPLQDKENKITKKRKKPLATVTTTKASDTKIPAQKTKKTKTEQPNKKKEPPTSVKSKKSTVSTASTKSKKSHDKVLKLTAKKAKSLSDSLFKKAAAMIKKLTPEHLPKLKTKLKVALKCPKNKKPGDDITFANPHNPGQKLRVKVPKDCFPGGTFKVTVPVKHRPGDSENEKDRNKLPRDLQEALDVFGKAYDEWCTAQSKVGNSFETFKEKQAKFDKLAKLFPKNLVTTIDSNYLKQVVRRARQNKYKRSKTAAAKNEKEIVKEEPTVENEIEEESAKEDSQEEEDSVESRKHRIVNIPTTGVTYVRRKFSDGDFVL